MIIIIDRNLKCSKINIRDMITDNKNFLIMLITLNIQKDLMRMALKKYQFQGIIKILILILQNFNLSILTNNKDNNLIIQIHNINKILITIIFKNKLEILNQEKNEWMNNSQILNLNYLIYLLYPKNNMKESKGTFNTKMNKLNLIIQILIKVLLEMKGYCLIENNKIQII